MCAHGDTVTLTIRDTPRGIDRCIAAIVAALNAAGVATRACCCGHGHRPGSIILTDGREIVLARSFDEARAIDRMFPQDIHGQAWGPVMHILPEEPTARMLKAAFVAMNATPAATWKRMKAEHRTPREIFDVKMRNRYRAMVRAGGGAVGV